MRVQRGGVILAMLLIDVLVIGLGTSLSVARSSSYALSGGAGGASAGLGAESSTKVVARGEPSNAAVRAAPGQSKSYAFFVGRDRTKSGATLLAGTGEEPSSHWLEIVPHQQHPKDAKITVGITKEADFPGVTFKIPLPKETYKYISKTYSWYAGFPPPLTNGGLNEHQVAVRDVWSPSRQALTEMIPKPQRGLNYSDLARAVLRRAETAREGAKLIGNLVDKYGYASYGTGNTHIIAGPREGWIVKEYPGGEDLWVAERLGPDEIRVAYPGYIGVLPENFRENPHYMASENFVDFAIEHGWYDPDSGEPFNVWEVYGAQDIDLTKETDLLAPKEIEEIIKEMAPITVDEMMALVRDPRISDDEAGYGQVAQLRKLEYPKLLATLWVAPTSSVTAPFIPWHMGVQEVPPELRKHRYLTNGSATLPLDKDFILQEATKYSVRVFKRLLYYTCAHPKRFYAGVIETLESFEGHMLTEQEEVEDIALTLIRSGKKDKARRYLTYYSNRQALQGLHLGSSLVTGLDARTQALYKIPEPSSGKLGTPKEGIGAEETIPGGVDCLANRDADVPSENDAPPEYVPERFQ